jgi:hypothetical protein
VDLAVQLAAVLKLDQEETAEEEEQQKAGGAAAAAEVKLGGGGRRVRFQAEDEKEQEQDDTVNGRGVGDEEMENAVAGTAELVTAVPASVARHAVRRRARVAPVGTKAAAAATASATVGGPLRRSCVVSSVSSTRTSSSKSKVGLSREPVIELDGSEGDQEDEEQLQQDEELRGVAASAVRNRGHTLCQKFAAAGPTAEAGGSHKGRGSTGQGPVGGAWCPSVVLVLDGDVQQLPWESLPGFQGQDMYR